MKQFRFAFALAALLATSLSAPAKDLIQIRMAHPPLALHELPLLVASENGFFEAEGLKVTHSFMTGGNEAATALIAGNVDVLNSALTQPMKLRAKNVPIKIIAGVAGVRDYGIVVDQKRHGNAKTLADLKGLRIATPRRGSDSDQVLRFILESHGFNLDRDVQLIQIGGYQNHLLAMDKGDVDASILTEPFFTNGLAQGAIKPVFDMLKGDGPQSLRQRVFTCLVVTDEFLKNKPDIVERIVRAVKKATDSMYKDPVSGIKVAEKYFPSVKPEVIKAIYSRLASATTGRAYDTGVSHAAIDAENKFLIESGVFKTPIAYSDAVADMSKIW